VSAELTTDQKGAIAETASIHAAVKLGIGVYKPVVEGGRYDLIFDLGDELVRVQCKWAPLRGDVIAVRCYSTRPSPAGFVRACYTSREVDALAAYCLNWTAATSFAWTLFGRRRRSSCGSRPPGTARGRT
jgi:hypothetical protein